jgi:hypothetical protein
MIGFRKMKTDFLSASPDSAESRPGRQRDPAGGTSNLLSRYYVVNNGGRYAYLGEITVLSASFSSPFDRTPDNIKMPS